MKRSEEGGGEGCCEHGEERRVPPQEYGIVVLRRCGKCKYLRGKTLEQSSGDGW